MSVIGAVVKPATPVDGISSCTVLPSMNAPFLPVMVAVTVRLSYCTSTGVAPCAGAVMVMVGPSASPDRSSTSVGPSSLVRSWLPGVTKPSLLSLTPLSLLGLNG